MHPRTPLLLLLFVVVVVVATRSPLTPPPVNEVMAISTNCTRDLFRIKLALREAFKGVVFAKEFSQECRVKGNHNSTLVITLPTSGCGIRAEAKDDDSIELTVKLVVQMDGKLRQWADVERVAKCRLPAEMMMMKVAGIGAEGSKRNGRMRNEGPGNSSRVRVWLELGGDDGAGAVEVGNPTTLGVRAIVPRSIGVRVVDCAALDGLGDISQKLIDERGCPVDEQVMPALAKRYRPLERGNLSPDGLIEKIFTTTFPAFKFPDRERLHVSCGVQMCNVKCPKVNCRNKEPFLIPVDRNLAKIEVFNSMAVTAPQIELDRLTRGRKLNVSEDDLRPRIRTAKRGDGVLCLSSSKLALAFAIMGLIFLAAVVVALCCLMKSRLASNQSTRSSVNRSGTSVFSTSSSGSATSHSRFGSKFLVPYQGRSMPYGRVY